MAMLGAVAVGITGGVVVAQSSETEASKETVGESGKSFAARVATILGLELTEEQVQNAFRQARKAKQDERYSEWLRRQVELGLLEQEQADENYEWYKSRPDTFTRGYSRLGPSRFGGPRPRFGFKHGMEWRQQNPDGATTDSN